MFMDPSGHIAETAAGVLLYLLYQAAKAVFVAAVAATAAAVAVVAGAETGKAISNSNSSSNPIHPLERDYGTLSPDFERLKDAVFDSYVEGVKKEYKKSNTQLHHIVAQTASAAAPARDILRKVNITIDDDRNLVELKTGFHLKLHNVMRPLYYNIVNDMICVAYDSGTTQFEKDIRVSNALKMLQGTLSYWDEFAPY